MHSRRILLFSLILLAVATSVRANPKETWMKLCSRCHGEDGTANTKMGKKLRIKNLSLPKIQARLTDDRIKEAILQGNKNEEGEEIMPSFKEKTTEADRTELVGYIRSLATKE